LSFIFFSIITAYMDSIKALFLLYFEFFYLSFKMIERQVIHVAKREKLSYFIQ